MKNKYITAVYPDSIIPAQSNTDGATQGDGQCGQVLEAGICGVRGGSALNPLEVLTLAVAECPQARPAMRLSAPIKRWLDEYFTGKKSPCKVYDSLTKLT